jgi:hypothetical protein
LRPALPARPSTGIASPTRTRTYDWGQTPFDERLSAYDWGQTPFTPATPVGPPAGPRHRCGTGRRSERHVKSFTLCSVAVLRAEGRTFGPRRAPRVACARCERST